MIRAMGQSYRELIAWQKARALVTEIYKSTETFPSRELYGLTSQIRRAAVSVPSNIAGGTGAAFPERIQALSKSCTRFSCGSRDANHPCARPEIFERG